MWMACCPGGRFFKSSLILTPLPDADRVAVPIDSPCAFFNSTMCPECCAETYDNRPPMMIPAIIHALNCFFIFILCLRLEFLTLNTFRLQCFALLRCRALTAYSA